MSSFGLSAHYARLRTANAGYFSGLDITAALLIMRRFRNVLHLRLEMRRDANLEVKLEFPLAQFGFCHLDSSHVSLLPGTLQGSLTEREDPRPIWCSFCSRHFISGHLQLTLSCSVKSRTNAHAAYTFNVDSMQVHHWNEQSRLFASYKTSKACDQCCCRAASSASSC